MNSFAHSFGNSYYSFGNPLLAEKLGVVVDPSKFWRTAITEVH